MKETNINQIEIEAVSAKNVYFSIIESLLFVSGEPLDLKQIASIIECSSNYTKELLKEMTRLYSEDNRGIRIINSGNTYSLATKPENSDYIEKLLGINSRQALSQAAIETLAIIAYKQPITRVDIDDIRGVKSDRAIASLLEKGLIKECGRLEMPGRPILYGTTEEFLKYFGLNDIGQIPDINSFIERMDISEEGIND